MDKNNLTKLVVESLEKKPYDMKETFNELIKNKVHEIIERKKVEVAENYFVETTEEDDTESFFEEFHAEYGHLPVEEQLEIMNSLMSVELTEEEETEAFFAEFHEQYGHLSEEEQEAIMNELMLDEASLHSNLKALLHPKFHKALKNYLKLQTIVGARAAGGAVAASLATGGHPLATIAGGAMMGFNTQAGEALKNAYDTHQKIAKQHDAEIES